MRIAFDAMAPRQYDRWSRDLAKAMPPVDGHGDHCATRDGILFVKLDFWLRHVAEWTVQSDDLEKLEWQRP
jgi:hypothetical protein